MLTKLLNGLLVGLNTFLVVWLVLVIIASIVALPFNAVGFAALIGLIAGLIAFLSGRTIINL